MLRVWFVVLGALGCWLVVPTVARAHVGIVTPEDDEIIAPGTTYTVTWEVLIPHDTEYWQVELSTDGGDSFERIAANIPLAETSYDWDVPADAACEHCMLLVIQDNAFGSDYSDIRDICIGETCTTAGGGGCTIAPSSAPGTHPAGLLLLGAALIALGGTLRLRAVPTPRSS